MRSLRWLWLRSQSGSSTDQNVGGSIPVFGEDTELKYRQCMNGLGQTPFDNPGGASLRDCVSVRLQRLHSITYSPLLSPCEIQLRGELLRSSLSRPVNLYGCLKTKARHRRGLDYLAQDAQWLHV
ncbi:unnamed protein product [Pleuronectes platessa]|uniref:Uncharacterized protein n=1 Tax=Pleuronectes platessa TaxID=8262 RepID=A0A9N7V3V0_PLEPL|nr:unnamed protein product [Pleuronectes platessa]